MRPSGALDSFSTILSGLAKRLGLQSHLFELRLQQQWHDIIGEPVGSHTWPAQIRFKKLYLIVRNSVWLQQLIFLKPTLLAKLNEKTGSEMITDIAFRVGEIPERRVVTPGPSPESVRVSDAALIEARAHAAAVQDPELRTQLASVMAEAFSRSVLKDGGSPPA
jgi:Dna[CI] antecedent, DciA